MYSYFIILYIHRFCNEIATVNKAYIETGM